MDDFLLIAVAGIIIVVAGVIFGIPWGLPGIVVGSCISNLYRTVDLLIFVPKKITHNKIYISAFRMIRVFLNVVLICVPSFIIKINVSGYFEWVCWSVAFVIYG